ncbi:hypothetical protein [Pontibacter actiniarum]|uniref:Uncharacterized protein n=1 Tax=Pontibacter actiniarum TaxID=323450 RepID=A0A1X9YV21_9BACT|nr:hypothetical protein [Pontibacter actiniarum]ARS36767.1 hypothetical protein CA264_15810 [Pontibacter actiniarum]
MTDKFKDLVERLLKKTEAKTAIWAKSSLANEFKLVLSKGAITTDSWHDSNTGEDLVDLRILNENGDIVEDITFNKSEYPNGYGMLQQLHSAARRSYYKVDETIDSIFKELDSDKTIGKRADESSDLPF